MSIKRNYIYNSAYQVLLLFVPLITTPYLSRVLGSNGVGTYSYGYSIVNYFMMFIIMGLENYGSRTIAENRDSKERLTYIFSSIYYMQFLMGCIVSAIYLLYVIKISNNQFLSMIFGINILATCLNISWCLSGMELFKIIAIRTVFALVKKHEDVPIYCFIMAASNLLSQIIAWPIVLKNVGLIKTHIKDAFRHFRPNLLLFLTVVQVTIYKSTDKLMLGLFDASKMQVGFYELSERIISIPNMLVVSLGTVMLPRASNIVAQKGESNTDYIFVSIMFSMLIASSMCFGIMGIAKEFVPLFYGVGYEVCVYLCLSRMSLELSICYRIIWIEY